MPTTYTHYAYGQEIRKMLPEKIRTQLYIYEDYYNIGVHGPDILFYYRAFSKNKINQYGVKVHHEPMKVFLRHAFSIYKIQQEKEAAFAYLAGFMTHYILDSTCHPYIRQRIEETGIGHTEIERDWDVLMMKKDYLDPIHYKSACHIEARACYGKVIAPYYGRTPKEIRASLFYMRIILNHFFRSAFGIAGWMASFINQRFFKKLNFQHYFIKRKINPANRDTCRELYRRYKSSRSLCANMIEELYDALHADDISFCEKERFHRDFL